MNCLRSVSSPGLERYRRLHVRGKIAPIIHATSNGCFYRPRTTSCMSLYRILDPQRGMLFSSAGCISPYFGLGGERRRKYSSATALTQLHLINLPLRCCFREVIIVASFKRGQRAERLALVHLHSDQRHMYTFTTSWLSIQPS